MEISLKLYNQQNYHLMINTLSLLRPFTRLSHTKFALPTIQHNLASQHLRLAYNPLAFFAKSPKRNSKVLGQFTLQANPTNKLAHEIKVETQGSSIKAMTGEKSVSYKCKIIFYLYFKS